jgi:putative transposase
MSKYSDEQRQVAVQHYLDHDRCNASTVKALGYPCRETLTVWIDELHPEVRQRIVGRAPNVQRPLEFKNAAVIQLCTRNTSAQEIADKLLVCRPTSYNWKKQLLGTEAPVSVIRQNDSGPVPKPKELTELQQQVDLLQRNIRRLQLEHDLLKKANELLKKGLGVALQLLSNREKTLLVDALKHTYALAELFAELARLVTCLTKTRTQPLSSEGESRNCAKHWADSKNKWTYRSGSMCPVAGTGSAVWSWASLSRHCQWRD